MKFRIIWGYGQGYRVQYSSFGDYWQTCPDGHCITYWGARLRQWRLRRRARAGKSIGWDDIQVCQ